MKKNILLMAAAIVLAISGCSRTDTDASVENAEKQEETPVRKDIDYRAVLTSVQLQTFEDEVQAPDFSLASLSGDDRSLESFRGSLVMLNFWASWCGPCAKEKPSMVSMYSALKDKGLEIVSINLQEDKQTAQTFADEHEIPFTVLLDKQGEVGGMYGVRSIPTTYIIGRDGTVLGGAIGAREWDEDKMISAFTQLLDAGI
jgi:peroxiredoxin